VGLNVAICGATGAVGQVMRELLEARAFPVDTIRFLASERSVGREVRFHGEGHEVQLLSEDNLGGLDLVLSSVPSASSKRFSPAAVARGAVVVDNSSAFRMDAGVPLVVPECNAHALQGHEGIIANPNCSTIQMVVALKPLHDISRIKRIVVSTYQSVSGAGLRAIGELLEQTRSVLHGEPVQPKIFPHRIAFECIPQIPQSDAFGENGYTSEEMKIVNETRKILEDPEILICPTTVRVPVTKAHSESVLVETERPITLDEARKALAQAPGVVLQDDPCNQVYPLTQTSVGRNETFVGRLRRDLSSPNGLAMWIVADNLRKGAATNAVQIAELLAVQMGHEAMFSEASSKDSAPPSGPANSFG
jgi:aspartate-semialdehyde dehydrogenase